MSKTTITGADLKAFYSDPAVWGAEDSSESWYVEDFLFRVDGEDLDIDTIYNRYGDALEKLPDDAKVTHLYGYLCWQGNGAKPATGGGDIARIFEAWQKSRTTHTIVATIEIDKRDTEALARIEKVLTELGAKFNASQVDAAESKPKAPKP